jgi:glycosyltransferase involved in cell wall biosynthesis
MLSVIIPSRNSPFATKTVNDLLEKAEGEVEIIVNVDEHWPDELTDDKRVIYVHPATPKGMRAGINAGLQLARGKYIMKCDDHCMFAQGYDKALMADMQENWLVIPRRYSLDAENWTRNFTRPVRDYHYLCFPQQGKEHDWGMHGVEWHERDKERTDPKYDIDDTMSFQGNLFYLRSRTPRDRT